MVRVRAILDILTYCIALIGYAPLFPFLEALPRWALPAAVVAGLVSDRRGVRLGGSLPTIVSVLFFLFYASRIRGDNLVEPVTSLLVLLLSVRVASEKKARNYLQIFALSLFCLAASSLYSLDSVFLAYLLLLFFLVAVALVLVTFHGADEEMELSKGGIRAVASVSIVIPAAALPLIALFFAILPRTQYPLWNFLNAQASAAGFTEKVEPGRSASVGEAKNPVFRAECPRLDKENLYWRGIVLSEFTRKAWIPGGVSAGESGVASGGKVVHQTIYPEPGGSGYLFTLNVPLGFSGVRGRLSGDLVLRKRRPLAGRIRYEVDSLTGGEIRSEKGIDRGYYLRLPSPLSPRMEAVGRKIRQGGRDDRERVESLKGFFAEGGLHYATSGLPMSAEPLDEFLFDKKRGNCEFFASSFALLLRAAGVPSRVVGGYLGGEYNELAGYYLVTEEMAHAWVEAFISGKGWVTVDPSTLSADFRGSLMRERTGVAYRLEMAIDSWNYYWNKAVIGYDLNRQFQLARSAGRGVKRLSSFRFAPKNLLPVAVVAIGSLFLIWFLAKGRWPSREERLLKRFLSIVGKRHPGGISPSSGVIELASGSGDPALMEFAEIYSRALYRDTKLTKAEYRALLSLLRRFRSTPPGTVPSA